MNRVPNWSNRLHALLRERDGWDVDWRRHDCVRLALGAVEAVSGTDYGLPFRDGYDSELGARRLLRHYVARHGLPADDGDLLRAVVEHAAAAAGLRAVGWKRAQRGNLALVPNAPELGWPTGLGVVVGERTALAASRTGPGRSGVLHRATRDALVVWDT